MEASMGFFPIEARYSHPIAAYSGASRPEAFVLHAVVEACDILSVAIEKERRSPLSGADDLLACLTPARVRHVWIDVRPEAILRGLQRLPQALRTLIGKGEAHDRLDRFKSIFPRQREAQRRAVLPCQWMSVGTGDEESKFVGRFRHGDALDIGPRVPGLTLARRDLGVPERFHPHIFRRAERACEVDQLGEREAGPGDRHPPCFNAAVTIRALLKRQLAD